jgi:hypothetical protein
VLIFGVPERAIQLSDQPLHYNGVFTAQIQFQAVSNIRRMRSVLNIIKKTVCIDTAGRPGLRLQ